MSGVVDGWIMDCGSALFTSGFHPDVLEGCYIGSRGGQIDSSPAPFIPENSRFVGPTALTFGLEVGEPSESWGTSDIGRWVVGIFGMS